MSGPAILYVHDLRGSGVVVNAMALARKLGAERETILCAGYAKGLYRDADVSPARLVTLAGETEPRLPRWRAAMRLRALIRETGAGLAMSMGNFGHVTVFAATRGMPVKAVYRISNEIGRPTRGTRNLRRRSWQRLLLATADRLILVGRALAEQPLFADALASGKAAYIPNGVDVDSARVKGQAPVPHPWLSDGGPAVVLTIGRIHPQKNLPTLIDAFAIAAKVRPLRLIVVGTGEAELTARLKEQAREAGLTDSVLFAGETDNVFAWLARSDLFALVSKWEGSSTALLEALAVGTPILASRQAGDAAHVLADGRYGVLVDAGDASEIAAGILRQLSPERVLPSDRVDEFRLERTHALYLEQLRSL